jgi:hypothetical protein
VLLAPAMVTPGSEFPLLIFHPTSASDIALTRALLTGCDGNTTRRPRPGGQPSASGGRWLAASAVRLCPLRLSEELSIKQGSLRQVAPTALALTLVGHSNGTHGVELNFDPCGPPGEAAALQLEAPAEGPSVLQMAISSAPSWVSSSFGVTVTFSQPVLKINASLVAATGANLTMIEPLPPAPGDRSGTRYQLWFQSRPYAEATFSLPPISFTNWAEQIGAVAYPVQLVSVPGLAPEGGLLALAGRLLLPVGMLLSTSSCMAAAGLLPGAGWVACGGQLLRSLWHLQTLVSAAALAGPWLPDSFADLSKVVHWAAMDGLASAVTAMATAVSSTAAEGDSNSSSGDSSGAAGELVFSDGTSKVRPFVSPAAGASTGAWITAIRQHYGSFALGSLKLLDLSPAASAAAGAAGAAAPPPQGSTSIAAALGLPPLVQGEQRIAQAQERTTAAAAWGSLLAALLALGLLLLAAAALHLGVGLLAAADPHARFKKAIGAREQLPVLSAPQLPLMAAMAAAPALLLFAAHILSLPGRADRVLSPFMAAAAASLLLGLVAAAAVVGTAAPVLAGREAEGMIGQCLQQVFGSSGDDAEGPRRSQAAEQQASGDGGEAPGGGAAGAAGAAGECDAVADEAGGEGPEAAAADAAEMPLPAHEGAAQTGRAESESPAAVEVKPHAADDKPHTQKRQQASGKKPHHTEQRPAAEVRQQGGQPAAAHRQLPGRGGGVVRPAEPLAPAQLLQLACILEPALLGAAAGWESWEEEDRAEQVGPAAAGRGSSRCGWRQAQQAQQAPGTGAAASACWAQIAPGPVAEAQEASSSAAPAAAAGSAKMKRQASKVARAVAAIREKHFKEMVIRHSFATPPPPLLSVQQVAAAAAAQHQAAGRGGARPAGGADGPAGASKLTVARLRQQELQGPRPQRMSKRTAWQQQQEAGGGCGRGAGAGAGAGTAAAADAAGVHDMVRRLELLSRYGFLVSDLLDERSRSAAPRPPAERRAPPLAGLLANVLCFLQHAACCALLGVLQARPAAAAGLLVAALAVKGVWLLYCVALRPYRALAALLAEAALSALEVLMLALALLASWGGGSEAVGALALAAWLAEFGLVALVETARGGRYAVQLYGAARRRLQQA